MSISTNPGVSSDHSAQVRIGICDLSSVPGLVDSSSEASLARSGARWRSMDAASWRRGSSLVVAERDLTVAAQKGTGGQHGGQSLAGWGPHQHPADGQPGEHRWRELGSLGRPGPGDLDGHGGAQGRSGVVVVPPGQLDQLVEDPLFLAFRASFVGQSHLFGDT